MHEQIKPYLQLQISILVLQNVPQHCPNTLSSLPIGYLLQQLTFKQIHWLKSSAFNLPHHLLHY